MGFWSSMDRKEKRSFIFQCITMCCIIIALIYMFYLSGRVADLIQDETAKTALNYLTSYGAILVSMMAFMIVTLFDLYHVTVKELNMIDTRIHAILLRDYNDVLCEYCYCRDIVQELELGEWLKDNPEFAKDKPIEE